MLHQNRPIVTIKQSLGEKLFSAVSLACLLLAVGYLMLSWQELPEQVPLHFNALGEADRFGGKASVVILPILGLFMWGSMTAFERVPYLYNYLVKITEENAEKQYRIGVWMMNVTKNLSVLLFAYLIYETVMMGKQESEQLTAGILPAFLVLIFGAIAWAMFQMVKNK
ncbi:DUF1648 domain-containing protein [Jeotgalibacillus sp. R-1-5s-1]|uniref:DUF1648 domain-containing protein n=1 Tax=Jeotgalibacillus sp. R-1-5s-1 TaxID=2555897 RepID=UPI00141BC823|nr:DUF1648 domain-containing protein [Jeotgalibacillus sp. R-1-5s-1]